MGMIPLAGEPLRGPSALPCRQDATATGLFENITATSAGEEVGDRRGHG